MRLAFLSLIILAMTATAALAGDVPDMKGTWLSESAMVAGVETGIYHNPTAKSTLVIQEQRGRVFLGYKKWTVKGETFREKLAGGIAPDGEVYIGETKDGQMHGDLSADGTTMTLFYVEGGPDAKTIEATYIKTQ